jgi:hypothetical protein
MSRRPAGFRSIGLVLALAAAASPVTAAETTLPLLQCGDDEREDAGGACLQETDFLAGTSSVALHLRSGGEAYGCDSEWATSVEFDLSALAPALQVFEATLIVHKTGYSDDSQGFFYLGAFPYEATGGAVAVARSLLTPETTLDIVYPSAANVDLAFDVTSAVREWLADGADRAGFLLAGVYSEVGYEDWISIGGCGSAQPPRLLVVHEGTIGVAAKPWSGVKCSYR